MFQAMGVRDKKKLAEADRSYAKWAKTRISNGSLKGWIVETSNGIPVGSGCVWMRPIQPGPGASSLSHPYLLSMYTHSRYRRRGIASMVVDEAIKWCENNGYDRIVLHASDVGRKVYLKFGFKPTREMMLRLPRSKQRKT